MTAVSFVTGTPGHGRVGWTEMPRGTVCSWIDSAFDFFFFLIKRFLDLLGKGISEFGGEGLDGLVVGLMVFFFRM